ncbi:MAG: glucose-6-phosphate isomerase, partial [Campylobacter sp.]|nr:glucose-6-phosphate isomerase [Campylobacter sp.]
MVKNSLFFKKAEFSEIKSYAKRLNSESESGEIGYYDLPNFGDEIIKEAEDFFKDKIYDNIVLVGIGGSSVGVRAILRALRAKKMRARLRILDNIDGFRFDTITQSIEFDKTIFIISSKSGTTVETISIFKAILDFYKPSDISKNFIFITDNGSKLEKFANQNNAKVFNIPKNVG